MNFLEPFAGLLAAGIGVPLVILSAMLRLRRRPVRVSTILFFTRESETAEGSEPFSPPAWSLLLFLHLLLVLLIAAAIARPTVPGTGGSGGELIIVIDRSASMNARGFVDGPTSLDLALRSAQDRLLEMERSASRPRVAIVTAASQADTLISPTERLATARRALDEVMPTDEPLDTDSLASALRAAIGPTSASDESGDGEPSIARRVVILTDAGGPSLADLSELPAAVEIERFTPEATDIDEARSLLPNAGIVAVSARRTLRDPDELTLFVGVVNTGPARTVRVLIGRQREAIAATTIELPAATDAGPGRADRSIAIREPAGGVFTVQIDQANTTGDALAIDDRALLRVEPASRPIVRLVHDQVVSPDPFLADALGLLPAVRVVIGSTSAPGIGEAQPDVLVLDRVENLPIGRAAIVTRRPMDGARALPLIRWDRRSPLLAQLALDDVVAAVQPLDTMPPDLQAIAASATELAATAAGPALLLGRSGDRDVLIVNFAIEQSNWPLDVSFAIVLDRAVRRLAQGAERPSSFTTGGVIRVSPAAGAETVTLRPLGGEPLTVRPIGDTREPIALPVPERAGLYLIRGADDGNDAGDTPAPVNLLDIGESGSAGLAIASMPQDPATTDIATTADNNADGVRELWPLLAIIILVLLPIETLLATRGRSQDQH